MEENQVEQLNTDENILQQNYQYNMQNNNIYSVPPNPPQYSQPKGTQIYQPPNNQMVQQMIQSQVVIQNQQNNVVNKVQRVVDYTPLEIISFLSWFLFMSAKWDFYKKVDNLIERAYKPILYNRSFIEMINLIISIIGFLVYVKNIIYKRNNNLYISLFGQYTKLHCIPLFLYAGINIVLDSDIIEYLKLNESSSSYNTPSDKFEPLALFSFYLIFSLLCLLSIIFIYYSTDMNCEWYIVVAIKKGVYSMLIVECLYHFLESIFYLRAVDLANSDYLQRDSEKSLYRGGGIAFSLIQGIIIMILSLYFKDITMPILNFLMYYGMVFNFYNKSEDDSYKGDAVVVIEIIMTVVHFFLIVFMLAKYKEKLLKLFLMVLSN